MKDYPIENDSLGDIEIPATDYYGAQTQRAINNFPISGIKMPVDFIRALALIKRAAAETNIRLGLLEELKGRAIMQAANEVITGDFNNDFLVDIYQNGSGTSTNMNMNEVIANRAIEILGGEIGSKKPVHPNDHVNKSQSSNDVTASAIHIAALENIEKRLIPALKHLHEALEDKALHFDSIVKVSRTHLQDDVPIRLGQEFGGYASQILHNIKRIENVCPDLRELALGGTVIGTGLNCPKEFAGLAIKKITYYTGIRFTAAKNRFEAQSARDAIVETSGQLKTLAISLMKISKDLQLLSSGPNCGFGEIILPIVMPGSSIHPCKVNPDIPESIMMLCATVIGNDAAICVGGQHGNLQLNAMMPMMCHHLLQSVKILSNGCRSLADRCINRIKANEDRIKSLVEKSMGICTALVPLIGFDETGKIVREAISSNKSIKEIALKNKVLSKEKIEEFLEPIHQTKPGIYKARINNPLIKKIKK